MRSDQSQVQVRLPTHMHHWLKAEGMRQERSVNWLINKLLDEARAKSEQVGACRAPNLGAAPTSREIAQQ